MRTKDLETIEMMSYFASLDKYPPRNLDRVLEISRQITTFKHSRTVIETSLEEIALTRPRYALYAGNIQGEDGPSSTKQ